jgi:hypothetical protein
MNLPAPNGYTNAVSVNWDNDLATTTGRVKVPIAGIYLVTAQVITGHSSTGSRGLYLQVNGTEQIQVINLALTAGNTIFQACILRKLAANDLVGISYWQNSGVAGGTDFNLNVSLVSPL